ncbi:Membrane protease YdiL, CAAX protease family [Seinonella peptonophila]|uniref:Membrane protease YdiL, CAAX protease family n=1 Tax=Seinonella peptonophila TaxID=112248 RepID=A0A1M4XAR2_9BACL|nr:CPBP family intramembrane glutamic endopeptidase [Seinonella peptonophila]SHE90614.1 Membrane protease YdiL, CAAX protease family [Seinonella peptonophila]
MRTFSVLSLRVCLSNEKLSNYRHLFSAISALCFFATVPLQFALLDWIQTTKGTWLIIQGKIDNWPLLCFALSLSFIQLVSSALFLFLGAITLFRYERDRWYLTSSAQSLSYFLAWIQSLTILGTILTQVFTGSWYAQLLPYLPHLWMIMVFVSMFYPFDQSSFLQPLPRKHLLKAVVICMGLYVCVFFLLDHYITKPIAEWFSLELSSWREQNIDQSIQQAGKIGGWAILSQWLFIGCIGPIAEEILFRGLLQGLIAKRWGHLLGILLPALCFALFHVDIPLFSPLFVLGLILGWLRYYFGVLWVPIAFHMLNNSISVCLDLLS